MKKMNINIASPCHENWDAMTSSDKGKFCASCQKTVVDFTNMSDREIIEYFSKSTGSVCGRLTDEQLSKDIVIPPKPIPWVKYFFRITFPAFIMSLKSCIPNSDLKQNITKTYKLSQSNTERNVSLIGDTTLQVNTTDEPHCTVGVILGEINTKIDSSKTIRPLKHKKNSATKHNVAIRPIPLIDSPQLQPVSVENIKDCFNSENDFDKRVRLGGVSSVSIKVWSKPINLIKKIVDTVNVFSSTPKIQLYPNPVASNSRLNIKLNTIKQGDYLLSLITSNGIIVQNQEVKIDAETNVISMDLKTLLSGTYIVRLVDRATGKSIAQKLLVL
jgi:hypothetical protein